jgi:putative ABC transport system ATP-binding protein
MSEMDLSAALIESEGERVVSVRELVKRYDGGLVEALRGVSFDVRKGEFFVIMGPSGSGKSTLLYLLGALDEASSGTVSVFGEDLAKARDLEKMRREKIGFVFQLHHLIPTLSLLENVELPALPMNLSRAQRRRRAAELLDRVGLEHRRDFLPVKASGGERQRAAVARALMNEPALLLADEPTGSVDTATGERILDVFQEFQRERGLSVVMITHNAEVAPRAERLIRIVDGKIAEAKIGAASKRGE